MEIMQIGDRERRLFSAGEVARMLDAGILAEGEHVELLGGELVMSAAQGPVHAVLVQRVAALLEGAAPDLAHVRQQLPLEAGLYDLPEPDVSLTRGSVEDYLERHPRGGDVVLAVEIAVTNLAEARRKEAVYARAGVPAYWIVDVPGRRLHRFGPPVDGVYSEPRVAGEDAVVVLPDGSPCPVDRLLP